VVAARVRAGGAVDTPDRSIVLLLTVAMVAATTWAVMAADWADSTGSVLLTSVVAVVEAALLARSWAGRLAAAAAAPLLGILVIVPLTLAAMPADGGEGLRNVIARYAVALTTGLYDTSNWGFLVGLCAAMWLVGFVTGWLALRERRGVLALLPCYVVLAINVLNAPSPSDVAVPQTLAIGISLLLLARVHLGALEQTWRRRRLIALPGTDRRYSRAASGAAVVLVLLAIVVPPATSRDVSGFLSHIFGGNGSSGAHAGNLGGKSPNANAIGFSSDTRPGGALVNDPRPVLSYTLASSDTVYLGQVNDTIFDQGNWYHSDVGGIPNAVNAAPGSIPRDRDPSHGGVAATSLVRQVQARINFSASPGDGPRQAVFPGEPDQSSVASRVFGLDGSALGGDTGPLLTVDHVDLRSLSNTLVTVGLVSTATEDQLRQAGATAYPDWVTPRYVALPAGGTAIGSREIALINDLARQWTSGATNNYDRAKMIEGHLRSSEFTYTLTPPQVPSGQWPIAYFLQTSHTGYCQYFASSMGALLRALQIPTRLVSGYGPGTQDDSSSGVKSFLHTVTSSDAHVWVEAYFPGYGWIPFEPTPSSPYGVYDPIARGGQTAVASTPAATPQPTSSPSPSHTPTPDQQNGGGGFAGQGPPRVLVGSVGGLVLLLVLTTAATLWLFRPRGVRAVWRRVNLLGRLFGARQRPAETFAAYAKRLANALPPDTTTVFHRDGSSPPVTRRVRGRASDALALIAEYEGKAGFSRDGLTDQETVRWRRAWRRICRAVPLLLWRRLLSRTARPT
jgi:transglutaminase-like putative cysteine protease